MFLRWTGDHVFAIPFWEFFFAVTAFAHHRATVSYVLVERPILRGRAGVLPGAGPATLLQRCFRTGPMALEGPAPSARAVLDPAGSHLVGPVAPTAKSAVSVSVPSRGHIGRR